MPHRCAFGCKDTSVVMHVFPNPEKFPERFKTWVSLIGGKLETSSDFDFFKKKRICDIHFTDTQRNRNKRLNALAVPTLHLPASSKSQQSFTESQCDTAAELPTANAAPSVTLLTNIVSKNQVDTIAGLPNTATLENINPNTDHDYQRKRIHQDHTYTLSESPTEEHEVTLESPTEEPEVMFMLEPPIEEGPFSWQKVTEGIDTLDEEDPADADVTFCSNAQLVPDVGEPASPTRSELSCDVCQACITGFRYACVQCADCDLCDACEARGEHAAHYVLRIPRDKTHSEAQAVLAALRRTLADHSALPQLTEVKEEVKNEDPLAEVEASTEVYMQADVDGSEDMQMEEEYLELDSLFSEDTDKDSVTFVAPTAPEKRKMPEDADVQTFSPNKRKYIRHRTQNTSVLKETNIEKGSSFVDEDTISSVQASNENRLEHATKSSHAHEDETSDTQFLLELFGAGSSRELFVNLKKLSEDEIINATRPAQGKR